MQRKIRTRPVSGAAFLSILALALGLGFSGALPAQDAGGAGSSGLPRNFREFSLGMGLAELKAALEADELFYFRGDRDVSFLPRREETLVETTGFSFVRRSFFQLEAGRVFIMAFVLDSSLVDHYSVYTTLVRKYGEPASINPREALWESPEMRLSLERPLTVKYIDREVFDRLVAASETGDAAELFLRQDFLDDF